MAVSTVIAPRITGLSTTDLAYPVAIWISATSLAGDLSGGDNDIQIQFGALPQYLISIENLSVSVGSAAAARNFGVIIATGEASGAAALSFRFAAVGTLVSGTSYMTPESLNGVPRFISNPIQSQFNIEVITPNTNAETALCAAWGYIWSIEARRTLTGPRRP